MSKLRGVNLGGWLVLERWMTPSLFAGTEARDEYQFMQTPGALEKIRDHQKNFIRESDFKWLRDHGINAVRIPVGYWIFEGDDPYVSSIGRLDWAIKMCAKYELSALICMHGAPGSQNGNDHSGKIGSSDWFDAAEYQERTIEVLALLAARYSDQPAVWGIELLNEPRMRLYQPVLRRFYRQAYDAIRAVGRPGLRIIFSDGFTPRLLSGALKARGNFPVVLDHHWYHFFIWRRLQRWIPLSIYWRMVRSRARMLERLQRVQPVIIGEWNGIIGGEKLGRYPESEHKNIVNEHIRRQLEAYRNLEGWFYWNYKHEHGGVYNFRDMVEVGDIKLD